MNVRQLRKLVLETINEERRPKRKQHRAQNRKKVMAEALRRARLVLEAPMPGDAEAEKYYDEKIADAVGGTRGGNYYELGSWETEGIKDPTSEVFKALISDNNNTHGITFSASAIPVAANKLFPSQNEIGQKQSLGNVLFGGGYAPSDGFHMSQEDKGGYDAATKNKIEWKNPVMIANTAEGDNIILDGHHRWSQVASINPAATMNCLKLNAPNHSIDDVLQMVHAAIAEMGNTTYSKTSDALGANLLAEGGLPSKQAVIDALKNNQELPGVSRGSAGELMQKWANGEITAKELYEQTSTSTGGSKIPYGIAKMSGQEDISVDDFVQKVFDNASAMNKPKNQADAPGRPGMPQAADTFDDDAAKSVEALDKIGKGEIYIPDPNVAPTAGAGSASASEEELQDSHHRTGTVVSEHKRQLSRWNKLAGLLKD